jgi:transposase
MAPTTMHRSTQNIVTKNDRRDARMIASNLANNTYKAVYVPDDEDVATKEYIRMRNSFRKNLKRVKQHIISFMLRQGIRYPGKSPWTQAYMKWLKTTEFSPLLRETLDEYLLEYEALVDKIERFDARIVELSKEERYAGDIGKLRSFKGIDTTTAMTIQVEISDFERFESAKSFASFLGLTPSEDSSGSKVRLGSITKQGNSTVRTALIESARALVRGNAGYKSKALKARQRGQESKVIAYADRAVLRLQKRYNKMIFRGKKTNVAVAAIARELACFVWGVETGRVD